MPKKILSAWIAELLQTLYPKPGAFLDHFSPYELLIGTVLSARCTDQRVNQVSKQLFALARTPEAMVQLSKEQIQTLIRPCGLSPFKANAIWELSAQLLERFGGQVPETLEELETLPGVGHKTASVVVSQGFHKPAFPVDTHIFRSARRWGLSDKNTVQGVEKDLKALFPEHLWATLHLQIIAFAREHCRFNMCKTTFCPICTEARRLNIV